MDRFEEHSILGAKFDDLIFLEQETVLFVTQK
jgi:hypothetical protein